MHPLVRDLYKRVLVVGRDYPTGLEHVKKIWKPAFFHNKHLHDEEDILRAVHKGRQMVKEMQGVIQLKKYRSIKARYHH